MSNETETETSIMSIKTVIVDDNKQVRYLIKEILDSEKDIKVCDEAATVEDAKRLIAQWKPDITIFDILLDEYSGDFLKEISILSQSSKIIIFSAHPEDHYAERCLKAGAHGYVCKDKAIQCLASAIRSVYAGNQFVSSKFC